MSNAVADNPEFELSGFKSTPMHSQTLPLLINNCAPYQIKLYKLVEKCFNTECLANNI